MKNCEYYEMCTVDVTSSRMNPSQQVRELKTKSKPCCTSDKAKHTEIHIDIVSTCMSNELRCNGDIDKCQIK
jgi:hypothetical protein